MVLAALAGLVFVVCTWAQPAAPPANLPPKQVADSLREYVVKNKTRHSVGLYMQKKKVGWMVTQLDLGKYQGKDVAVEVTEMLLSLSVEGSKSISRETETVYYSLDGDGPIVYAKQVKSDDNKETTYTAVPSAKGMTITANVAGATTSREVPLPKANIDQSRRLTRWLQSTPKEGATFEHWATDWDEDEVDSKEVFTYLGKSSMLWGGIKTDVYKVKVDMKGAIFNAEVLADGNPIRGKIGGLLEMKAEAEEIAKKLDSGDVDMLAASSIKVDHNLGDSRTVTALTLEAIGLEDFKVPESHRQHQRQQNGKTYIDLNADFRIEKGTPLSEAEVKKFTAATPTVQSDHERVKKLAAKIVGDETDPIAKSDKLKTWVYQNLKKRMDANSSTTLGVLDRMAGDCTEHSLLFVSLARAAGVPARELTGVAHVDKIFGWHAWAEVHDGHQWVSVDPTWNELYVDATHIVFSHDNQNHAWLNVLGNVSFKMVRLERKE
jgi:hypothetical protein